MRYSTALAALASSAAALTPAPRENPRVVGLALQRRDAVDALAHDGLRRRQNTVQQTLDNRETLYYANASLGTPAQPVRLHIDTGSSDLWVNSADSALCTESGNRCGPAGTYSANASSTYAFVNNAFNISYVDGSGAAGDYATDTFRLGGATVADLQFGIGYRSSSAQGILGIGYTVNEAQVNRFGLDEYANLPQKLKDDGRINSVAYSLWLNDLDASTGSILFGGVDADKYTGQLSTLPIIPEAGVYAEFVIALTDLGADGNATALFSRSNVPVLLDSGSSLMYLPDDVATALYARFDARYDARQGTAFVDCALANTDGSLDFGFSGVTISVPYNELVLVTAISRGRPVCIFGISPAGSSISVLGDTFLRSAYVVYDLAHNQISLAQTAFNASSSSIREIQDAPDGVPGASLVPNAVSTAAVGTAGPRLNGPSLSASATLSSTAAAYPAMTASPLLAAAGMGVLMGFNGF